MAGTDGFEQRVSGRKAADAPAISFLREHAEVAAHIGFSHLLEERLVHVAAVLELSVCDRLAVAELGTDVGQVAADNIKDRLDSFPFRLLESLNHPADVGAGRGHKISQDAILE